MGQRAPCPTYLQNVKDNKIKSKTAVFLLWADIVAGAPLRHKIFKIWKNLCKNRLLHRSVQRLHNHNFLDTKYKIKPNLNLILYQWKWCDLFFKNWILFFTGKYLFFFDTTEYLEYLLTGLTANKQHYKSCVNIMHQAVVCGVMQVVKHGRLLPITLS